MHSYPSVQGHDGGVQHATNLVDSGQMVRHCVEDRRGGSAVAARSSYVGRVPDRGASGHPCQDIDQRDANIPLLAILGHRPDRSESVDKVNIVWCHRKPSVISKYFNFVIH